MKYLKYLVIIAISFLAGCSASTQQSSTMQNAPALPAGNIRFLVPWGNGKITVQSVVEEVDSAGYKLRNLSFYRDSVKSSSQIFSQRSRDYAVALIPLRDNAGNMLVIWQSGVAYRFSIYSYQNDQIVNVLEAASQTYPELFYEKKDSEHLSILVTNVDLVNNKKTKSKDLMPVNATLYRWKDGQYVSFPNIPWPKRFNPVK
ncbi:MAG: hypothetical protein ACM34K_20880 [Bacillota bacterium]